MIAVATPSETSRTEKLAASLAKLAAEKAALDEQLQERDDRWRDLVAVAEDRRFRVSKIHGFLATAHAQTEELRAALFSVAFNGDPGETARIAGLIVAALGSIPELETVAAEAERLAKIECEKARQFADANNVPAAARPDWLD